MKLFTHAQNMTAVSMPHDTNWIGKSDLAQRLGVSLGLINRLISEEGLPHLKVGRSIRFNYEAVIAWLERRGKLRQ